MSLRLAYRYIKGEYNEAMQEIYAPIAAASTAAVREAGEKAKLRAREVVQAAGFSKSWSNSIRSNVYPKRGDSANAAALIFSRIPYSGVFEDGAEVRGKPMMWVPFSHTPKKIGRKKMTPMRYSESVGDLYAVRRVNKKPLLMGKMRVSKREAAAGAPYKVRLSALRRGSQQGSGSVVSVPLFFGISSVKIRKKFDVGAAVEQVARELPQLFLRYLKVD